MPQAVQSALPGPDWLVECYRHEVSRGFVMCLQIGFALLHSGHGT